jgi:hypothetical protein
MVEDLLRQLPEEYARLADRRAVMHEAAEVVAELHESVVQLGDVIVGTGLPARAWRSPEADLRLLSGQLPAITVETCITRLAEFAAGLGPEWLHGDAAALDRFHAEVATLHDLVRSLGDAAQRMRVAPPHQRILPVEVVFGKQRVVTAIEEVTLALSDLLALAPFMGPLSVMEWQAIPEPVAEVGNMAEQEPIREAYAGEPAAGTDAPGDDITLRLTATTKPPAGDAPTIRLRDKATKPTSVDGATLRLREYARTVPFAVAHSVPLDVAPTERLDQRPAKQDAASQSIGRLAQALPHSRTSSARSLVQSLATRLEPQLRRVGALVHRERMPVWLTALLGLILVLTVSAILLEQVHTRLAQPVSTRATTSLVVSPIRLTLACARHAQAPLTLDNPTARPLTWQAHSPPTLTVSPVYGTLAAGKHVTLRVTVVTTHPTTGTITITAMLGKLAVPDAVPYALACT